MNRTDKKYTSEEIIKLIADVSLIDIGLLYDIQTWLRDIHNIHITIRNSVSGYWWALSKADNGIFICDYNCSGPNDCGKWDCYEDALDSAILTILNSNLIKKYKKLCCI